MVFRFVFIQISGLRGKGIKALLGAPFAILRAVLQARKIIKEYQPNAVLGMGWLCIWPRWHRGKTLWRAGYFT